MSDSKTTFKQLKSKINRFRKERNWRPSERGLAISIALESAELLENFQWEDYEKNLDTQKIQEELADILIYCLEFAIDHDIDISDAIEKKVKKNGIRYPVKSIKNDNGKSYYALKRSARANSK